jgi:hypothetical protein
MPNDETLLETEQKQEIKDSETVKLNNEHLEKFKNYYQIYKEKFGLVNWRIVFSIEKLTGNYAVTRYDLDGRVCVVVINEDWDITYEPLSDTVLERTAKHEAIHLMLARFSRLANRRFSTERELEESEEEIVRVLENII